MNKLKELRNKENLTQRDLAQMLNVGTSTYLGYEKETSEPTIETLVKLANYYGVTMDYLIGRDFKNELGYLNDSEKELLNAFRQLKPINQIKIIAEIKGILIAQN